MPVMFLFWLVSSERKNQEGMTSVFKGSTRRIQMDLPVMHLNSTLKNKSSKIEQDDDFTFHSVQL